MSHLDEGLLTELIDNELSETERQSAEAHLAECGECRRVFAELKAFALEADGLVAAVEVPARTVARVVPLTPAHTAEPRRWGMHRWRTYAWAASVVLALGLGWAASDLRYAPTGRQNDLADAMKEGGRAAPVASDIPSTPSPEPAAPGPAATNAASQVQTPRNRAGGAPAEGLREEKAPAPVVAAEQAARSDADRDALSRLARQPPAAAKLAQDAAGEMDSVGIAAFGNASLTASPAPSAAPEMRAQGGLARRSTAGFRQVGMEDAVRTLGGSIRLMDGLEARRILVGSGSVTGAADSTLELVRVVYEDPPGRELWLDQQRPQPPELKLGARYAPLPGDTTMTRDGSGPLRVRWIDEHGFRLALTGYLASDSLRAMILRVH